MIEQNRNKKFIKDIFIYGVGNLGARLIMFLIFPLYTFFITPDNLGYYNTALMTIFLIMPFVNIQLRDGVFRFLIDNNDENNRKAVINQSYRLILLAMVIASLLFFIVSAFIPIRCGYYILGLLLTMSFYEVQIQIVRGLGHTKLFVGCGILSTFLIAIFSIIFVVCLKWNIEGIFIANILARLFIISYIEIRLSIVRNYFSLRVTDTGIIRMLLKYCSPLIMVVSFMWVIGNSYIYFINYYYGFYEAGQFSTVLKFATIIELLAVIVFQAWQETSVLQLNSKDRDRYYSSILNSYLLLLTGVVITLSFILKSFYGKLVDTEYESSIIYLYVLCVAQMGYALQAFIAAIFQAKKNTMRMLYIAFVSSIVSLFSNYLLIKQIGLMGIAIAYGISFFFMFICYLISVRKTVKISFSTQTLIVSIVALAGGGIIFYHTEQILWRLIYWGLCMIAIYFTFPKTILSGAKSFIIDKYSNFRK
ncbi:MAG: polysaccharide biosynthesis C-terminal domain-containing protein [Tannerella sp.]|jgi:O-antigen/teichoic acid export membrane protein|nr:polysaccharide biosynthesis C-terminal domain-containing protein [Tannerella sp.]